MIEETLKNLSCLQIEASRKGIEFDIDLRYNNKKIPTVEVALHYTVTGGIQKGYVFNTTFGDAISPVKQDERYEEIRHFISTVTGPIE